MSWGFDFSLSNIGEKLQQLKDDVESSIETQLRADRLGLTAESSAGGSRGECIRRRHKPLLAHGADNPA